MNIFNGNVLREKYTQLVRCGLNRHEMTYSPSHCCLLNSASIM